MGGNTLDRKPIALFCFAFLLFFSVALAFGNSAGPAQDPASETPDSESRQTLSGVTADQPPETVRATVDVLNIRSAPSLDGSRVARLLAGEAAAVLETQEDWLRIETADGTIGYVFRQYTTALPSSEKVSGPAEADAPASPKPVVVASATPGLRPLGNTHLAKISGQGLSTDMTQAELDGIVGQGFISALTPEEIAAIDAQGAMSLEESMLKTRDLERVIAQGVTFVVDKSKVSPEELEKIQGQGTVADIGRAPFSVQAGVYKIRENAISMLSDLKGKGYDPYIFQTVGDTGETLYAVRIGDYETLQDAYAVTTHFQSKENRPAIVTYINSLKTVSVEDVKPAGTTVPVVAPVPKPASAYEGDLGDLYTEMQLLREEVERLRTESEAREMLRMTEAEARKEEEEILSAASRNYTMSPKGTLNFDYSFGYTYDSYDVADWTALVLEHSANHNINNTVAAGYSFSDNFRANVSIPFVYKYQDLGQTGSKSVTDLGDVSVGANWQPFRTGEDFPALIFSSSISIPTGRSPYEINPREDLSTGAGLFAASLGVSASKSLDPVVAYGGLQYTYALEESGLNQHLADGLTLKKVEPSGGAVGLSMGLAYAMSYKASIHAGFSYAYIFGTTYHYDGGRTADSGTGASGSLSVGTGWKLDKRTISVNLGIGLTNDASDFSFSFRIPFDYEL
ncbi:SH3 type 3 domain protein [Desulfosudis oleivorans Hxd3]|uniref:SH3 type 3 domain protein n=1 Tax=Desulfosudis oleivorans (strain DSM 6200 / JCM 39069 / Hxd3) TaxID=96561 RepID=A8ZVP0_DESOH|nr:SH3 type 3 domain protein [Desulfosudis oleivorans Hxd3]